MKLLFCEIEEWERQVFEDFQADHEIVFLEQPLDREVAKKHSDTNIVSNFIYSDMRGEVLSEFNDLKLIATRSTGFDHIDLNYCTNHDITICNVPSYGQNSVAEHTFGLLLTISHNLFHAIDRTRKGDFSQQGLQGFDLMDKTLGVIGTGDIGEYVIRIAKGFQMQVVAFDVVQRDDLAAELDFSYLPLDEVLNRADIVTLHVPENPKTRHMISANQFAHMKDGVILLNTSRGTIIDVEALVQALAEGKVAAAGLDVLPEEPVIREDAEVMRRVYQKQHNMETLLADHMLLRLQNVYVTPHTAFNTREAVQRILETTHSNIEQYMNGQPQNVVNEEREKAP
jgi:D-lactate dehydrogenase